MVPILYNGALKTHPCILITIIYAKEVKNTGQGGEGESGRTLKAESL